MEMSFWGGSHSKGGTSPPQRTTTSGEELVAMGPHGAAASGEKRPVSVFPPLPHTWRRPGADGFLPPGAPTSGEALVASGTTRCGQQWRWGPGGPGGSQGCRKPAVLRLRRGVPRGLMGTVTRCPDAVVLPAPTPAAEEELPPPGWGPPCGHGGGNWGAHGGGIQVSGTHRGTQESRA